MTKRAIVFPGQGVQTPGMGKDLYENFAVAREVFEEVDHTLNQKLSHLMFEGEPSDLTSTANAQPAIMAVSIAAFKVLTKESSINWSQKFHFVAGHSLGEYTALCASGALDLATTTKLLRIRGESMQQAVPEGEGAMVALLGGLIENASKLAEASKAKGICVVANDNAPDQVVLSGEKEAIQAAIDQSKEFGFKRAIPLEVSAPFHSPLMTFAAERMREAFKDVLFGAPQFGYIPNVKADLWNGENIADLLIQQVCGGVRWRETVLKLEELGTVQALEIGQGKVLSGLIKKTCPNIETFNFGSAKDLEAILKIL